MSFIIQVFQGKDNCPILHCCMGENKTGLCVCMLWAFWFNVILRYKLFQVLGGLKSTWCCKMLPTKQSLAPCHSCGLLQKCSVCSRLHLWTCSPWVPINYMLTSYPGIGTDDGWSLARVISAFRSLESPCQWDCISVYSVNEDQCYEMHGRDSVYITS